MKFRRMGAGNTSGKAQTKVPADGPIGVKIALMEKLAKHRPQPTGPETSNPARRAWGADVKSCVHFLAAKADLGVISQASVPQWVICAVAREKAVIIARRSGASAV